MFILLRKINRISEINKTFLPFICTLRSRSEYVQGQTINEKEREYFYYIDHQGMLFLDDSKMKNFTSCFKEKKFLKFFFTRIRQNKTGRYPQFPFISLCGKERNYIRCDDVPIVYTHLIQKEDQNVLTYGHAGDLMTSPFLPEKIHMSLTTGRVYHPSEQKYGGVGLIASKLAIQLSKHFKFEKGDNSHPTHFEWSDTLHILDQTWFADTIKKFDIQVREKPDDE